MAHRTRPRETEDTRRANQLAVQQVDFIGTLSRDRSSVTAITNAPDLAGNVLKINEILEIVRGGRPPATDRNKRSVYDAAVRTLGNGDQERTIRDLQNAQMVAISNLAHAVQKRQDAGPQAEALENLLTTISRGAEALEARYVAYRDPEIQRIITDLLVALRRTEVPAPPVPAVPSPRQVAERAVDTQAILPSNLDMRRAGVGGTSELRILESQPYDPGNIHYITGSDGSRIAGVGGTLTSDQLLIFGGNRQAGQTFVTALANAFAASANNEANGVGAQELYNALNGITNPQLTRDPHFTRAKQAAQQGDRETALRELSAIAAGQGPLSGVWNTANHVTVVKIDQRAVVVFRASGTARYEFPSNMEAFRRYLSSGQDGEFEPRLIYAALNVSYEMLRMRGYAQDMTWTTSGVSAAGSPRALEGTGHVVGFTPELAMGASIRGTPIILSARMNFGYREYEMEPVSTGTQYGTSQETRLRDSGAYLGLYMIECRFLTREGHTPPVRLTNVGIGAVGTDPRNAVAYFRVGGDWHRGERQLFEWGVAPMFRGFMTASGEYQARVGADFEPLNFLQQWRDSDTMLRLGPRVRVEYNTATQVWTFDSVLGGELQWAAPGGSMHARLGLGVVGEVGGREWDRVPTSPTGQVGFEWRFGGPSQEDRERQRRRVRETVPERVEERSIRSRLYFVVTLGQSAVFVKDHTTPLNPVDTAEARRLGTDLAGQLDGYFTLTAPNPTLRSTPSYQEAMRQLRAGNLSEGLETLGTTSRDFRDLIFVSEILSRLRTSAAAGTTFVRAHPGPSPLNAADTAEARRLAIELGGFVRQYYQITVPDLMRNPDYLEAMRLLEAGNLREGLDAMGRIPYLRDSTRP